MIITLVSCSRCRDTCRFTISYRLAGSRCSEGREGRPSSEFRNKNFLTISYHTLRKANTRSKQLQRYQGNWATIEILKTLLKNRRSYRSRIGSLDEQDNQIIKKEIDGEEGEDGNGGISSDQGGNNSEDNPNNSDSNGSGNEDDDSWENMYMRIREAGKDDNGSGDVDEGEDDEDTDGKDNERGDSTILKRKVDDEPATATRAKKMKLDDSRGHQSATNSTKRTLPKRKAGKKKN